MISRWKSLIDPNPHHSILVQQNKIAGLLMETGTPFVNEKLHGKKYFASLIHTLQQVPESVQELLKMSRGAMEMFQSTQKRLVRWLVADPNLAPHESSAWPAFLVYAQSRP